MIERYFIEQGMKKIRLEEYFKKELNRAGFTGMKIDKTPLVTRVTLRVAKPGLAIGKKGSTIKKLTAGLETKFKIDNPQIEIQQIEKPELDATAMVDKIVALLSRGYSWRSVAFRSIEDIMNAGAQGVELVFKGKLAGKGGRKRKERIAKGYMKKAGDQAHLVDYCQGDAYPKAGAIGVKLRIIKPDTVFPDKIRIEDLIEARKNAKKEGEEKETKEEVKEDKTEEKEEEKGTKKEKEEKKEEKSEKKEKPKTEKKEEKKKDNKEEEKKKEPVKKEKKEEKLKEEKPVEKKEKEEKKEEKAEEKSEKGTEEKGKKEEK